MESFDDLGLPTTDCQRIVGRVVNMSQEDPKLKEPYIGLINTSEDSATGITKILLNLSEVQELSLFEGEIIIAEGFADINSKFNVNRVFKPAINPPKNSLPISQLRKLNTDFA